jgi:hypothetical protein
MERRWRSYINQRSLGKDMIQKHLVLLALRGISAGAGGGDRVSERLKTRAVGRQVIIC